MKNRIISTMSAIAISCLAVAAPVSANAEMKNADLTVVKTEEYHKNGIDLNYTVYNDGTVYETMKASEDIISVSDSMPSTLHYDKGIYSLEVLEGLDCFKSYAPFEENTEKTALCFPVGMNNSDSGTMCDLELRMPKEFYPEKISKGTTVLSLKYSLIGNIDEHTHISDGFSGVTVEERDITIPLESSENEILWCNSRRDDGIVYEYSVHRNGTVDYVLYNGDNCYAQGLNEDGVYKLPTSYEFGMEIPKGYDVEYDLAPTTQGLKFEKMDYEKEGYNIYHIWKGIPRTAEENEIVPASEVGAFFWLRLTPNEELTEFKDIELHNTISGAMLREIDFYSKILSGDANCNGTVDLSDAVMIMQSLANPDKYKLTAQGQLNADCTSRVAFNKKGDGVTNKDALAIQQYALELVKSLPVTDASRN